MLLGAKNCCAYKKRRTGAATPGRQKGNEMNTYILHAKRAIVKGLAVLVGLWFLSALAVLNVPALVAAILIENALIGAYFKLEV